MKKYLVLLFICIAFAPSFANENNTIERKKELKYVYNVNSGDKLNIRNQFGDVKIVFWNQKSVKANISITTNAPKDEQAEKFINAITVNSTKDDGEIFLITEIGKSLSTNSYSSDKKESETNFKIDYLVYMPENMELTLNNAFGSVFLPSFTAGLNLNLNYCKLFADNVSNQTTKINLNFGTADIKNIDGGSLNSNFTKVSLGNAKNVIMHNNHGNLKAKSLEDIQGVINYTEGFLGSIKDAVNLKLNYTNKLIIGNIDDKIKLLEIFSNFSNINLPIDQGFNCNFDVKTTHGKLRIDPAIKVFFTKNSETDKQNSGKPKVNIVNVYQGTIGKTQSNAKIIVVTNYGSVVVD
jgi:hypothetical protein